MHILDIKTENIAILASTFLLLHKQNKTGAEVNMRCVDFHPCGTVACHAGWFAIAKGKRRIGVYEETRKIQAYGYTDAAREMAKFIGFESEDAMCAFFGKHPKLWGNNYGNVMFLDPDAFNPYEDKVTLKMIGKHWGKVHDRILKAQEGLTRFDTYED